MFNMLLNQAVKKPHPMPQEAKGWGFNIVSYVVVCPPTASVRSRSFLS